MCHIKRSHENASDRCILWWLFYLAAYQIINVHPYKSQKEKHATRALFSRWKNKKRGKENEINKERLSIEKEKWMKKKDK